MLNACVGLVQSIRLMSRMCSELMRKTPPFHCLITTHHMAKLFSHSCVRVTLKWWIMVPLSPQTEKYTTNSNKSCMCVGVLVSRKRFLCLACGAVMDEPTTKMQLEVFLSCSSLSHCSVKIKVRCFQLLSVEHFHSRCRHVVVVYMLKKLSVADKNLH